MSIYPYRQSTATCRKQGDLRIGADEPPTSSKLESTFASNARILESAESLSVNETPDNSLTSQNVLGSRCVINPSDWLPEEIFRVASLIGPDLSGSHPKGLLRFSHKVVQGFFRYFFDHSYFFCARLVRPTTPQELNGLV